MHTSPFRLLNLAESCTDYNHDGSAILCFNLSLNIAALGGSGAMRRRIGTIPANKKGIGVASVVSLRAFANSANVPSVDLVELRHECLAGLRLSVVSPSCYSREPFTAFREQSCGGFAMATFAGESACLSTLIDAFHRSYISETAERIAIATPFRPGDGEQANGMSAGG
jgi:hypothetical protein